MRFWVYDDRIKEKRDVSRRKQNKENQEVYQYWPLYWRIDAFKLCCWRRSLRVPIFTGRIDAEAEAPILWPPDAKSRLIRKDPDANEDWKQEEKGTTEGEMVGWHHWLNGHEFEQTLVLVKDREAWHASVYRVAKSQTWLSSWTTTTVSTWVNDLTVRSLFIHLQKKSNEIDTKYIDLNIRW